MTHDINSNINPDKALELLEEGNKRYVRGEQTQKNFSIKRKEFINFQKPFATILCCSDSRVVPEFIFDVNIGDLFVIRTAGNLANDKIILGSLEYGIEHLKTPLLVILAHQSCGAVCATCDAKGKSNEGNIKYIIKTISPLAKKVGFDKIKSIEESAKATINLILKKSEIISKHVQENKLKIVLGYYSFEDGSVKFFNSY